MSDKKDENFFEFIIIGGGIAGTTCAQRLCSIVDTHVRVLILSATPLVKAVTNIKPVTKLLNTFDVEEKKPDSLTDLFGNLTILQKYVSDLDTQNNKVICNDGIKFGYDKLCICTGGRPNLIANNNPLVLGIRDTETVTQFQNRLKQCQQIAVVGNGGIATELIYEIENCRIHWIVKDAYLSHVFFDAHSAKFFETRLNQAKKKDENDLLKRSKYSMSKVDMNLESNRDNVYGSALGPDWSFDLAIKGAAKESHVTVEYNSEIKSILTNREYLDKFGNIKNEIESTWPIYIELTNGKLIGCDLVISATGVVPAVDLFTKNNKISHYSGGYDQGYHMTPGTKYYFTHGIDGGLKVNDKMETSVKDVFAAGDSCTASWKCSAHWFQMRLWTQACQMGDYAARSMWDAYCVTNKEGHKRQTQLDFCFEMFAHLTNFFGFKCILLGNYDARGLGNDYELLLRCTPGVEYVKIVVHKGKVQGALLIGETDLEETFENLILNQLDVSAFGENLINPDIDIEDYFD